MNLFRSEEHVAAWEAEHGLKGETLSIEQTRDWVEFIGKERPNYDYEHPRNKGTLGPFLRSIGLRGEFWGSPG